MIKREEFKKLFYVDDYDINRNTAEEFRLKFEKYLSENPYDTEIWMKFASLLYLAPLYEDLGAMRCLETVLSYDPGNVVVNLFLVYIIVHCKYFDDELFDKLCKLTTDNTHYLSMIEYAKNWYYFNKSDELFAESLEKSIGYCDRFVWNYVKLGQFYIAKNNLKKGYELLKKGLQNLEYTYDDSHPYNILDIEEFFNERFKGIHISTSNYKIILESFDPNSPWITGDFITKRKPEEIQ